MLYLAVTRGSCFFPPNSGMIPVYCVCVCVRVRARVRVRACVCVCL